jgi:AraC-like DNA-binding protein
MGNCRVFLFSLLFLLTLGDAMAQSQLDSLKQYSFKQLSSKFYDNEENYNNAIIYADEYLVRALKNNDTIRIADGYYFKSWLTQTSSIEFLRFNDSIISFTNSLSKKNKFYPLMAYFNQGNYYYNSKQFDLALESYLLALNSLDLHTNNDMLFTLYHRVGLLKSRYGKEVEALKLFKEVHDYYLLNDYQTKFPTDYLMVSFALCDSYLRNNKLDSAQILANQGKKISLKTNDSTYLNYFKFQSGLIDYKKGDYGSSIKTLKNSIPIISTNQDLGNVAYANFFIGMSYIESERERMAIPYFQKVDSIYQINNDIHPDLRKGYEYLIDYYSANNDLSNELKYIRRLLIVDQDLNVNYKKVTQDFSSKYDTPKLLSERDHLIKELKDQNKSSYYLLIVAVLFVLILLGFYLYQRSRKAIIQKRFDALLADSNTNAIQISKEQSRDSDLKNSEHKKELGLKFLNIPVETVKSVLTHLDKFEITKGYLEKNIKSSMLAKRFETNTKYLSAIINQHKKCNFSTYINNLRIAFAIEEIKNNKIFRQYTIKAIAEECGFGNTESFSKAFIKKTGINPSTFIQKLEKHALDS